VLFRAGSLSDAGLIFGKLAALPWEIGRYLAELPRTGLVGTVRDMFQMGADVTNPISGFGLTACAWSFLLIVLLVLVEALTRRTEGTRLVMRMPLVPRWIGYCGLILVIILFFNAGSAEFIYFTF
jgi:hypothetical protein